MGTQLTEVCDMFLSGITDYKINTLFSTSGSQALNTYLEPWLIKSIMDFIVCNQSLAYTKITSGSDGYFSLDLTQENVVMLSEIMIKYWLKKILNDQRYLSNYLSDHDFKSYSPAQSLTAKKDYLNSVLEQISQKLVEYSFANTDWTKWQNQDFGSV